MRKLLSSLALLAPRPGFRWRAAWGASLLLHVLTLAVVAVCPARVDPVPTAPGRVVTWSNAIAAEAPEEAQFATPGVLNASPGGSTGPALISRPFVVPVPVMHPPRIAVGGRVPALETYDEILGQTPLAAPVAKHGRSALGTGSPTGVGSGKGTGTGSGDGNGPGQGGGAGGEFFGIPAGGRKVVFVVDASRSMNLPHPEAKTRFKRLKIELLQTIQSMKEDDAFFIIFFNDKPIPMPAPRLQAAHAQSTAQYLEWMAQMRADGETDPRPALALALSLRPDVVYFLTDGDFKFGVSRDLESLAQADTAIHTIAFGNREAEKLLQAIAAANRGTYRFVP